MSLQNKKYNKQQTQKARSSLGYSASSLVQWRRNEWRRRGPMYSKICRYGVNGYFFNGD